MKRSTFWQRLLMTVMGISSFWVLVSDRISFDLSISEPPSYEIIDMGPHLLVNGLNDRGEAVGMTRGGKSLPRAFLWSEEKGISYLSDQNPGGSLANGINDNGQIVGQIRTGSGQGTAYLWNREDSGSKPLRIPGQDSIAYAVSSNTQIVGNVRGADWKEQKAFFCEKNGETEIIGTLGGTGSAALAVSAEGFVAGWANTPEDKACHAFRWSPKTGMLDLGTLGGTISYANAINDRNLVAGQSETADGSFHAFLHDGDAMVDLGTLGGGWSLALGLNDFGTVVGQSQIRRIEISDVWRKGRRILQSFLHWTPSITDSHAFCWKDGEMLDLNEEVDKREGWEVLTAAVSVNNRGEIVGFGIKDGVTHSFLLVPDRSRRQEVALSAFSRQKPL